MNLLSSSKASKSLQRAWSLDQKALLHAKNRKEAHQLWRRSIHICKQLWNQFPKDINLLTKIAVIYQHQGKFNETKKFLIRARRSHPNHLSVVHQFGNLYRAMGKTKLALKYYSQAVILSHNHLLMRKSLNEYKTFLSIMNQLKKKILTLASKDQQIRKKALRSRTWDTKKINDLDRRNTKEMKRVIQRFGWPTVSKVGKKASHAAWLLVQHADHDVMFQKKCLELVRKEYERNPKNIQKQEIAYLTDRVLVHKRKKQIFGTQFYTTKYGKLIPRPISDKRNLDKRRKEYDLEPFKNYLQVSQQFIAPKKI